MRILIIGGTRGCGLQCLRQGIDRGHTIRVLARSPPRSPAAGVQVVAGDARAAAVVADAVAGQDAVVVAIGRRPTLRPVALFSQALGNVVLAMSQAGVARLVYLTGVGAGDSRGHGGFWYDRVIQPVLLRTIYADKDASEQLVRACPLRWTLVRPARLTNGSTTAQYRILNDLRHIVAGTIARGDVAHFVLDELERNEFVGKAPLLTY